jgi:hypothetical protein
VRLRLCRSTLCTNRTNSHPKQLLISGNYTTATLSQLGGRPSIIAARPDGEKEPNFGRQNVEENHVSFFPNLSKNCQRSKSAQHFTTLHQNRAYYRCFEVVVHGKKVREIRAKQKVISKKVLQKSTKQTFQKLLHYVQTGHIMAVLKHSRTVKNFAKTKQIRNLRLQNIDKHFENSRPQKVSKHPRKIEIPGVSLHYLETGYIIAVSKAMKPHHLKKYYINVLHAVINFWPFYFS